MLTRLHGAGKRPAERRRAAPSPAEGVVLADRSRWLALAAITVVSFLLTLEDTAVSVALSSIRRDLGVGLTGLEWVVNAYTLALAVLVLPAGKLADGYGRRRVFLAGVAVFTVSSLAAGLAGSGAELIAARALQGAGAALAGSAALSIVSVSFPERERGAALGIWASASAVGLAVGPLAGAMLTEMFGWPWVFLVNVPLGVLAGVIALWLIPESSADVRDRRLPWSTVVIWGGGLVAVVMALTEAGRLGWAAPEVLALAGAGIGLLGAFAVVEHRARRRLLSRELVGNRQTVGANLVSLLSTAVMCNLFVFISMYLQNVRSYSAVAAGTALLPLTLAIVLLAPLAGRISDRVGRRGPIIVGLALLAAGLLVLSVLSERSSGSLLAVGLALAGIGIGFTTSPTTAAALDGARDSAAGESAGLLNTSRMIGLSLGIATMGAVISGGADVLTGSSSARQTFVTGLSEALRINAGIALVAVVIALATITGLRHAPPRRPLVPRPRPTEAGAHAEG